MGSLNQNCREIAQNWLDERNRPRTEMKTVMKWMLGFVRQFRRDVKNSFPKREVNKFIDVLPGYGEYELPADLSNVSWVGTQLGRYNKILAVNPYLATNNKRTNPMGMVSTELNNDVWYNGLINNSIAGVSFGWNFGGQIGISAWGNGQDYGDFKIDWEKGLIYTSPTFRYSNLVLKGLTSCIDDSEETCIEWEFVTSAEFYLDWRYDKLLGNGNQLVSEDAYKREYYEQVTLRNRPRREKVYKSMERIYGYVGH